MILDTRREVMVRWRCQRNCSTWAVSGFEVTFSQFIILAPFSHTKGIRAWQFVRPGSWVNCVSSYCFSGTLLRMQGSPFRLRAGPGALLQRFSVYYISQGTERSLESQNRRKSNSNLSSGIFSCFSGSALSSRETPLSLPFLA